MLFNPMPSDILDEGDVIVSIGKKYDMQRMNSVL
jgi:K+/H+ antiporter YhaU regulatory subunit KhtT